MNEKFCDDNCIYLSCNERFQNVHYNVNKERPPHICNKYKKRLYHLEHHPNICRCEECIEGDKRDMKINLHLEVGEQGSNIGIAKALTEILDVDDLREIAQYLLVFVENNLFAKNIGRKEDMED